MVEKRVKGLQEQHIDKTQGRWSQRREVGMAGVGEEVEGKGRKLFLNNNKVQKYYKK